jgi:hypothetical protein
MGREGGGGEVSLQATWDPEWTGVAPHAKEGFQVSKRDSGTGEGFSRQRGIIKGDRHGDIKGIVTCAPMYCQPCTYCAIVCMLY